MRVSQKIIKLLNATPDLKASEIASRLKISPAKIYQILSYLYKTNKVKRVDQRYSVQFELPMTGMPLTEEPIVPVKQGGDKRLRIENDNLRDQLADVRQQHAELLEAYLDTKAIVKYLEEKLFNK
jgi:DNA-binding transcriptional ArsR family regulator